MLKRFLVTAIILTACSSDEDSKAKAQKPEVTVEDKEELVASDNGLKKQVEALRKELDALKGDVQEGNESMVQNIFQVVADVAGIETDLTSTNARIDALETQLALVEANVSAYAASVTATAQAAVSDSTVPALWIYDGNGAKRARVIYAETSPTHAAIFKSGPLFFKVYLYETPATQSAVSMLAGREAPIAYLSPNCQGQGYLRRFAGEVKGFPVYVASVKDLGGQSGLIRLPASSIYTREESYYHYGCINGVTGYADYSPVTAVAIPPLPQYFPAPVTFGE